MKELNYYEILEIKENASAEVIKAAYKALAKKYHPDTRSKSNYDSQKTMADINEAYEVLSDENKRREYDFKRRTHNEAKSEQYQYNDTVSDGDKKESSSNYADINIENNDETIDDIVDDSGFFSKFLRGIGKEITRTIQNNNREIENAYLEGLSLDDYTLIKKFKYSKGYKRAGYVKALEQKELLERDYDGKLIPSYKFKQWF